MARYKRTLDAPLSEKEIELIRWLSYGKNLDEIAEIVGTSRKALANRLDRAWDATGTSNRTALVAMALRKGWIT